MFQSTWKIIVYLCVLAPVLFAADGAVLINQDRVMEGSVTPGDAPGFPVTISRPGNYRLTGDLTVPDINTTGIQITANAVTIDLNGFSIAGPVVCSKDPVACPTPGTGIGVLGADPELTRGAKVRNGTVSGMGLAGIRLSGNRSAVENVTAEGNAGGGIEVLGSVIASAAIRNGSFGIFAGTVRDSSAGENVSDGIILVGGGEASGNVSGANGGIGIFVPLGIVTGNRILLNKGVGISAVCPSVITGNVLAQNAAAIQAPPETGCSVANNATRP